MSGTLFGSMANYSCDSGYRVIGISTRMCGADGTWSGEEPSCQLEALEAIIGSAVAIFSVIILLVVLAVIVCCIFYRKKRLDSPENSLEALLLSLVR